MNWYDLGERYHQLTISHECKLSALPEEWQRELTAVWRLEMDVNNGGYLQFLAWWGRESYVYASKALKKIGALKMRKIIDDCQSLVDEHIDCETASRTQMQSLMRNPVIRPDGQLVQPSESILPDAVHDRIYELSYEFMDFPEDLPCLGLKYYKTFIGKDID